EPIEIVANLLRVNVDARPAGREQFRLPGCGGATTGKQPALSLQREKDRQAGQRLHAAGLGVDRRAVRARAHGVRRAPALAWKSAPLVVAATKPARIQKSPKRSPGSRPAA